MHINRKMGNELSHLMQKECCLATERNELLKDLTVQMKFNNTVASSRTQISQQCDCMNLFIGVLE